MPPNIVDGRALPEPVAKAAPMVILPEMKESAVETAAIEKEDKNDFLKESFLRRNDVKWGNVIMITTVHLVALYGLIFAPYLQKPRLLLWTFVVGMCAGFGVTGGAHRYWSHRAYKATTPLKIILALCFMSAGQNSIMQWVKDHRVHHKYSETDADPHNSNRGFFFSHVGWLMLRKHPEVLRKGKQIDVSDILNDPVTAFFERHFMLMKMLVCFVIPITVPIYFWGEDPYWAFIFQMVRLVYVLNATWSVNSFAHFFGNKPYNKAIAPVENIFVAYAAIGEGWHNYHHVFPSDYKAAEIGGGRSNLTTYIIDLFAKIGWAYDLKEPSKNLVETTIANRGDGTHERNEQIVQEMTMKAYVPMSMHDPRESHKMHSE